ncbi:MAG: J domain-containing protein [Acidobacteriota bacterium]
MMSKRKKRSGRPFAAVALHRRSITKKQKGTYRISGLPMIVDNEPVRRAARESYEKVRASLEAVEQKIDAYWRQEFPAYQRWMSLNFGPELTDLREITLAAAAKKAFLDRIAYCEIWCGMSRLRAYARVKNECEKTGSPGEGSWDPSGNSADDAWEDDRYGVNEDWSDLASEISDNLSAEEEAALRIVYEMASEMFTEETGLDAPDFETFRRAVGFPGKHSGIGKGNANAETERLKKLYRSIARNLHPDRGGAFSPREQQLWHRAQDAYKSGDSRGLQIVLSHLETEGMSPAAYQTVSEMRELAAETRLRIFFLEDELRSLQHDPSWRFTQKNEKQLKRLHKRVGRELTSALQEAQNALASMDIELAGLEATQNRVLAKRKTSRRSKKEHAPDQIAFNFDT